MKFYRPPATRRVDDSKPWTEGADDVQPGGQVVGGGGQPAGGQECVAGLRAAQRRQDLLLRPRHLLHFLHGDVGAHPGQVPHVHCNHDQLGVEGKGLGRREEAAPGHLHSLRRVLGGEQRGRGSPCTAQTLVAAGPHDPFWLVQRALKCDVDDTLQISTSCPKFRHCPLVLPEIKSLSFCTAQWSERKLRSEARRQELGCEPALLQHELLHGLNLLLGPLRLVQMPHDDAVGPRHRGEGPAKRKPVFLLPALAILRPEPAQPSNLSEPGVHSRKGAPVGEAVFGLWAPCGTSLPCQNRAPHSRQSGCRGQ
jgi:hypothetical protein